MTDLALRYRHFAVNFGPRGVGALTAGLISAGWAALGVLLWVVVPDLGLLIVVPALSAALIVTGLGWLLAEWTLRTSSSFGPLATMALLAVVLNALVIALVMALPAALSAGDSNPLLALVGLSLFFALYGLVVFGLPALVIALPSAYVWQRLLRAGFAETTRDGGR